MGITFMLRFDCLRRFAPDYVAEGTLLRLRRRWIETCELGDNEARQVRCF